MTMATGKPGAGKLSHANLTDTSRTGNASDEQREDRGDELVITRIFAAPRELVWQAWTQPQHMAHWCAPHGFTVTHCQGDLRSGGAWRSCMKSPEGEALWLGGVYRAIVEPERLVFTQAWDDEDGRPSHETLITVSLAEENGQTKMTFRQEKFASLAARDGHAGGWSECFERLNDYLPHM